LLTENPSTGDERLNKAESGIVSSETLALEARPSLRSVRERAEVIAITQVLEQTGWNRKRAAQLLRISYRGLLYKLRQHSIVPRTEGREVSFMARKS
jgi:DNA-binding NtrC family response regulator